MKDLQCPQCGKPGISILRKLCLGPLMPATCKACGRKVGVPYIAMLALTPFYATIIASQLVEPLAFKFAIWSVGLIVMSIIYVCCVPLESR